MSRASFEELTVSKPLKSLTRAQKSKAGRNAQGKVTTRHRGGEDTRLPEQPTAEAGLLIHQNVLSVHESEEVRPSGRSSDRLAR